MLTPPPARPWSRVCLIALILVAFTALAQAQVTAPAGGADAAIVAATGSEAPPAQIDNGLTAWMLVSSALVLLMVPGLALFYGGMVRAKNVLNMFLCCMVAIGVIGLHWVILGYALTFGTQSLVHIANASGGTVPWSLLGWDSSLLFLRSFSSIDPGSPQFIGRFLTSGDTTGSVPTGI